MFGVVDRFEKFSIAPGAADILGRAASCNVDQARIENTGFRVEEALDLDRVLPAVAKVIEISQRLCADIFENVVETGLARVERAIALIGIWHTPPDVPGADLIEVSIGPAHRGLDREMQTVEPDCERHLDPAQNGGLDVVEGDLEAGDGIGAHAATLRCSIAAA